MEHKQRALATIAIVLAAISAAPVLAQSIVSDAEEEYANGHYASALAQFIQRAQNGDAAAAEIAGLMFHFGGALYGRQIERDLPRARALLEQAARAGREVSKHMIKVNARASSSSCCKS